MRPFPSFLTWILLSTLLIHCLLLTNQAQAQSTPYNLTFFTETIHTPSGPLRGGTDGFVEIFRGIPYAQPPTGQQRFQRPKPRKPWTDTLNALFDGPVCPQLLFNSLYLGNEDCLYLNVYRPARRKNIKEPLPVLVWIYGGGYTMGDLNEFGLYNAYNIVKQHDYVFVAMNYRLASLGFLASEQLRKEDPYHSTGNMALLDQQLALQWIQKNIHAFGGDPSRVTLFGESAGGFSICWHLVAPNSQNSFSAAIIQSGTCDSEHFFVDYADSRAFSQMVASSLGCTQKDAQLQCLRDLPAEKLVLGLVKDEFRANFTKRSDALLGLSSVPRNSYDDTASLNEIHEAERARIEQERLFALYFERLLANLGGNEKEQIYKPREDLLRFGSGSQLHGKNDVHDHIPALYPLMPFGATIDGVELLDLPFHSIQRGEWARVPVVMGTVRDEGSIFVPAMHTILPGILHKPLTNEDVLPLLLHFFHQNATLVERIMHAYPHANYSSVDLLLSQLLKDFFFVCSARRAVTAMSQQLDRVWLYEFSYLGSWLDAMILGVYHGSELPYVFHNEWPVGLRWFTEKDRSMARDIGQYWSNMAHAHDPNGNNGHHNNVPLYWPSYNQTSQYSMVFDQPLRLEQGLMRKECAIWDEIHTERSARKREQREKQRFLSDKRKQTEAEMRIRLATS